MLQKDFTGFSTVAIHGSQSSIAEHAHITPIFATSAFTFDSAEQGMNRFSSKEEGYTYSRFGNPTATVAEEVIAAMEAFNVKNENGDKLILKALLHSSGQAAMATLFMSNLSAGDSILSNISVYGGTYEFLNNFIKQFGVRSLFTDMRDVNLLESMISKNPSLKLLHLETPANPTMQCIDIEAVCKVAKKYNLKVTIDNTFATPYLQQPFKYGVDFVYHSTTKFLNGHGTAIGGVLIGKDTDFMKTKVYNNFKLLGGNSNPFDTFLLIQGMKTLSLRMEKHCSNAIRVANFLSNHTAIKFVYYNGLPSHPDYKISMKQMRQPGSILRFELKDGFENAKKFINKLKLCVRAVSLGTVDTLVSHPASMSHSGMLKDDRYKSGITDGLIRMSVDIEDVNDILNDLDQALN